MQSIKEKDDTQSGWGENLISPEEKIKFKDFIIGLLSILLFIFALLWASTYRNNMTPDEKYYDSEYGNNVN